MEKIKFNPNNAKYYSEEFIKGFKCGVERQFNADMAEKTAEWRIVGKTTLHCECSSCGGAVDMWDSYCKHCGAREVSIVRQEEVEE